MAMSGGQLSRTRHGETGGRPQRPAQRLSGPALAFDLDAELEQLKREDTWRREDHNAKTLVKEPDFRIVLIVMKMGARLDKHHAPARVSLQTLQGQLLVHLPDRTVDLPSGHLLSLDQQIAHEVEALEESAFLLTIAWPGGGPTPA